MSDSNWIVTEYVSDEAEQSMRDKLNVGDTVMCISPNSRHCGQVGKIIEKAWVLVVEYPNTNLRGHHPARILRKIDTTQFDEDLFCV